MRQIGNLEDEIQAKKFSDYLYVQGIENQVIKEDNSWAIWIYSEDKIPQSRKLLDEYRTNPAMIKSKDVTQKAQKLREIEKKENEAYHKRMAASQKKLQSIYGMGKLTSILIAISVVVSLLSIFGSNLKFLSWLSIAQYEVSGGYIRWQPGLTEIFHGQIWRLITPIFIHYGIIHILFNMLWLRDLGNMIEKRQGTGLFALLVFSIAIVSNLGQYFVSGPNFGGMSGVVYGLLGYIWIRGKFDPFSGLILPNWIVVMMIGWFFLGFTGLIGHIANAAHGVGLAMGMAWGYILAHLTPTYRNRR